ncbi:Type II inositol polyphosphate 5-phosphatase 15 [Camellia lanceoleosa]|uniref:Type II inositol polyphosphate 5-phosphatase 15 n=1 Tax=Camellia lanceoleosa TaxID=1840588 RepID=A0ACC0G322_9ERIC|nr:Type II inositol polyphosphate 5-phosphatase 15 [Camellia lanceoleosa]
MAWRIEDDDGDFFASLSSPPPRPIDAKLGVSTNLHEEENDDDKEEQQPYIQLKGFSLDEEEDPPPNNNTTTHTPLKIFDRFYGSSSSDDDDDFYFTGSGGCGLDNVTVQSAGKCLDYMIQFLDRKLSSPDDKNHNDPNNSEIQSLPEFVASSEGTGIFKLPL